MIKSILIVCEGNVCRSPMAMGLFARQLEGAQITSAGTGALVGEGADPMAIELMAESGIDLRAHVATAVDPRIIRAADLVLTANTAQKQSIERAFPFARGRIFRLREHANRDVSDPYKRDRKAFEAALSEIDDGMRRWLDIINRTNQR
jgi:protein-tyrosine phosphatase